MAAATFGFGGEARAQDVSSGGFHSGSGSVECIENPLSEADIAVNLQGIDISVKNNYGVYIERSGDIGNIATGLTDDSKVTIREGTGVDRIYGLHEKKDRIKIYLQDSTTEIYREAVFGAYVPHQGSGDIGLRVEGGSATTSGGEAYGSDGIVTQRRRVA